VNQVVGDVDPVAGAGEAVRVEDVAAAKLVPRIAQMLGSARITNERANLHAVVP
jgi:hypothetical protein